MCSFFLQKELLVNIKDLQAVNLSGYCQGESHTEPPSCFKPGQLTMLDCSLTENSSNASIDSAHQRTVHEIFVHESINSDGKTLGTHHHQIRKGQVHNENVGL